MHLTGNRLLDLLEPGEFIRLEPHLTAEDLRPGRTLQGHGKIIRSVYFPTRGMISIITNMRDGNSVEVGIVGAEGMMGIPVVLGHGLADYDAKVQVPGGALRMPADVLCDQMQVRPDLRRVLLSYVQAFLFSVMQSAACNSAHLLEQRLARWFLMASDRAGDDDLPLTHQFIATMLGVRRAGVTVAAQSLQSAGLINYFHGRLNIVDRHGLEAVACECYAATKRQYERLFGVSLEPKATNEMAEYQNQPALVVE